VLPITTLFSTSVSPVAAHRSMLRKLRHSGLLDHKGHKSDVSSCKDRVSRDLYLIRALGTS
jgi:hypothetical protein